MSDGSGVPVYCPSCGYTTRLHAEVYQRPKPSAPTPLCPECAADPEDQRELADVDGLGNRKASVLKGAGYNSVLDLQRASQEQLAEVDGIGNALAARIKADAEKVESIAPRLKRGDPRR